MQIRGHDIGVCSWSIRHSGMRDLAAKLRSAGLEHTQLAASWVLAMEPGKRDEELAALRETGIKVTAGMINFPGEDYSTIPMIRKTGGYLPDAEWPARRDLTLRAAELMRDLGVSLLSTHVGFHPAFQRAGVRQDHRAPARPVRSACRHERHAADGDRAGDSVGTPPVSQRP